ncbi:MAG TPA: VWA domain-containing protein [Pyrinomonadaceae bacterium]|nr:VWA domain-containing protein [Pyrinomonadaceae bacterium]
MALKLASDGGRPGRSPARRPTPALLLALGLALVLAASARQAFGQNGPAAQEDARDEEVIRVRTDLVAVPFLVQDSRGRRVADLSAADFEVFDEGRRVEPSYFAAGTERVALLFLLDASGSTRETIARQREAALGLFERFGPRSRVAVMHFAEQAALTLSFTDEIEAARPAFAFEARRDSRTAIFDAALASLRAFHDDPAHTAERRIVVLLSDGLDTVSRTRAAAAVAEARRRNVSFYVIHLPLYWAPAGRLVMRRPSDGFRDLAEKTGGRFLVVGDERSALAPASGHDLRPIFEAVAEDLRGQYVVGFHAGDGATGGGAGGTRGAGAGSGPRRVEVRLAGGGRRGLRVRQLRETYTPRPAAQ